MPFALPIDSSRFARACTLGAAATAALSVVGFAGVLSFAFDLFANFRLQWLGLSVLWAVAGLALRRRGLVALASALVLLNAMAIVQAAPVAPLERTTPVPPYDRQLTVLQWNILVANRGQAEACAEIERVAPDVVFIQEVNGRWMRALNRGLHHYRFLAGRTKPGLAVFVRHGQRMQGVRAELRYMAMQRRLRQPFLDVWVPLGSTRLSLLNVHAYPPLTPRLAAGHEATLRQAAAWARETRGPVAVLGDFNMTRYADPYARFVQSSGLHAADRGLLPLLTWAPPWWPLRVLALPIDHAFVSDNVRVLEISALPFLGSDHRPLLMRLGVAETDALR